MGVDMTTEGVGYGVGVANWVQMVDALLALNLVQFGTDSVGLVDGRLFDILVSSLKTLLQLAESRHLH
jgi:hypothetical protein